MSIETAISCAPAPSSTLTRDERRETHRRLDRAKGAVNDAITRLVVFGDSASASAFEPRDASQSS
jgi:hypothetical protein